MPLLNRRRALLRLAAGLAAASLAVPAHAAEPAATVAAVASQAVELVKNTTGAARQAGFANLLLTSFDLPYMSQSALGANWARANPEQRSRFLTAAATAEARAYSERFGQYAGQTVTVGRVINRPNGIFLVESLLNQSGGNPPIKIEWELQDRGGGMRITDVKVEGVSMIMTRRSDFSSYISRNGGDVEALITELETRARR